MDKKNEINNNLFETLSITNKEKYTKKELIEILQKIQLKINTNNTDEYKNYQEIEKEKQKYKEEHNKSLALIIENEYQKLKLEELNDKINEAYKQLEEESKIDYLTKVFNRKTIMLTLKREVSRIIRIKENLKRNFKKIEITNKKTEENISNLTCAIIDIDYFKNINDTYGHLIGDRLLEEMGKILLDTDNLRISDFAGRYGGEEFVIILPDTNIINSIIPIERLSNKIQSINFKSENNRNFNITVSIGISEYMENDTSYEDILKRADKAMYFAKQNGRNSNVIYTKEMEKITPGQASDNIILYNLTSSSNLINGIRKIIKNKLDPINLNLAEAAMMTTSELCENAIKYGLDISETDKMQYKCIIEKNSIIITVKNSLNDLKNLEKLKNQIDRINQTDNIYNLYTNRLTELINNQDSKESRLGLLRIAYEGKFKLNYEYNDGILSVTAKREY